MGKLINQTNGLNLEIELADTFFKRFLGLMGRKSIGEHEGLLFILDQPSRLDAGIHMLFMRFDIAVIWLSEEKVVVDKALAVKWHLSYLPNAKAKYFLETSTAQFDHFNIGDQIEME